MAERPRPPYSSLTVAPKSPSSFICSTTVVGYRSSWSYSRTIGLSSRIVQRSMVSSSWVSSLVLDIGDADVTVIGRPPITIGIAALRRDPPPLARSAVLPRLHLPRHGPSRPTCQTRNLYQPEPETDRRSPLPRARSDQRRPRDARRYW